MTAITSTRPARLSPSAAHDILASGLRYYEESIAYIYVWISASIPSQSEFGMDFYSEHWQF